MIAPQKLRILMLCPQYRPVLGGYERAAERLSVGLVKQGHEVTVLTERTNRAWPAKEVLDGVEVRRAWCLCRRGVQTLSALWSLVVFLVVHGRQFDVWHAHQYGIRTAIAIAMGKIMRRPVVMKLTSTGSQGLAAHLDREYVSTLVRRLHLRLDAVVATTRETQAEAVGFGIAPSRVHLFGNAIDIEEFRPRSDTERSELRATLGIQSRGIVVYVGRFSPEKNPLFLIQAWSQVAGELPGWKLIFLGEGPLEADVRASIKIHGLADTVIVAGRQSNVPEWIGASDIYALPSVREGLSNSLIEAMASALPSVCTPVSGVDELVKAPGAGFIRPQGDVTAFAAALVTLAKDPGLRLQMGRVARRTAESRFAINVIVEQHVRLYEQLIAEKRQGASGKDA
jgi:glycosyltransferase involved in cell wall biosynthesis